MLAVLEGLAMKQSGRTKLGSFLGPECFKVQRMQDAPMLWLSAPVEKGTIFTGIKGCHLQRVNLRGRGIKLYSRFYI
jgi:hypothetical protein